MPWNISRTPEVIDCVVGFDIKKEEARAELKSIAKSTRGRYLDARNAGELAIPDRRGQAVLSFRSRRQIQLFG
ncbi:MAG: hypothetical protein WBC70_12660 [Candidatus Aminicenantales bacterium]